VEACTGRLESRLLWHCHFRHKCQTIRGAYDDYYRKITSHWFNKKAFRALTGPFVEEEAAYLLTAALICTLSFPIESILPEPGESSTHVCQLQHLIRFQKDTTTFMAFVKNRKSPGEGEYKLRKVTWHNTFSAARIDPMKAIDLYLLETGMDKQSMHGPIVLQDGSPLTRTAFNLWLRCVTGDEDIRHSGSSSTPRTRIHAKQVWRTCRLVHLLNTHIGGPHGIYPENQETGFHCDFSEDEIIHTRAMGALRALGYTPVNLISPLQLTGHRGTTLPIVASTITSTESAGGY